MSKLLRPYLVSLQHIPDTKGVLGVITNRQVPFEVTRIFWIREVPEGTVRGGHAHRTSEQLLICNTGSIEVDMEDLSGSVYRFELSPQPEGLYLPPMCWGSYTFRDKAIALCLASDYFNESDYIRSYQEFEKLRDVGKNF